MTKCIVRTHGTVDEEKLKKACLIYLQDKQVQKVIYEKKRSYDKL